MSKRYGDPIEVEVAGGLPLAFVWRGRRYDVDQYLSSWLEAAPAVRAPDVRFHRVLARPAGVTATGELDPDGFGRPLGAVYDISESDPAWRGSAATDGLGRTRPQSEAAPAGPAALPKATWRLARVWD